MRVGWGGPLFAMGDTGAHLCPAGKDPGERERRVAGDSGGGQIPWGGRTVRVPAHVGEAETRPPPLHTWFQKLRLRLRRGACGRPAAEGGAAGRGCGGGGRSSWLERWSPRKELNLDSQAGSPTAVRAGRHRHSRACPCLPLLLKSFCHPPPTKKKKENEDFLEQ